MRNRLRVVGEMLALSVRADPRAAVVVVVLAVLGTGAVAATGVTQRWVVDSALSGTDATVRIVLAAALGALAHAATATLMRIQVNLRDDLSDRVEVALNHEILSSTAAIPTIEHLERRDYLDRLAMLRAGGASGTRALAVSCWVSIETGSAILSLVLSVWLLADIHPALALLAPLGAAPLLATARGNRALRRALDESAQLARREQALHHLCTDPGPGKEIRIAGNGPHLSEQARKLWDRAASQELSARLGGAGWRLAGWACFILGFTVAVAIVARLAQTGRATPGDVVLVITLAGQLRNQVASSLSGLTRLAEAGRITSHYLWLRGYAEQQQRDGVAAPAVLNHGVVLNDVSFGYAGGDRQVLRHIDLNLPSGAVVALVGVNGSGKTTLVKLLAGMYRPTSGAIRVDGKPLEHLAPAAWSNALSGAFQDFAKPQVLLGEAVGIGDLDCLDDEQRIRAAVALAGAEGVVDSAPAGLSTQLGRTFDGIELSHGQWQKLALARCLMREAPLLRFLDEPTAALDPQAEHDLFERFVASAHDSRRRGGITVLVSHRFSTVDMADLICVLANGRVIESGTHAELIAAGGEYASLYRTQAQAYA